MKREFLGSPVTYATALSSHLLNRRKHAHAQQLNLEQFDLQQVHQQTSNLLIYGPWHEAAMLTLPILSMTATQAW